MQRDPIDILKAKMIRDGQLDDVEFDEMKQATERLVHGAIEWAKEEPFPPVEALYTDVYYEEAR